ncbi:uncharacterized protein LOC135684398 [Rhopilema esculentum]|uniref:uncharacterized protein LOC135684398 n=1 Tax=Rhopilema esculentum TaxID=499914 RepID=UPI0031E1B08B|eukprot:gene16211-7585_t
MVNFEDIRVNADVQIQQKEYIWSGKVAWKGNLLGRKGNWVGVRLKEKVGNSNGSFSGKQCFKCPHGYGVFVKASELRFPPTRGRSSSAYRTVSKESHVDDTLFGTKTATKNDDEIKRTVKVPKIYARSASDIFKEKLEMNERKSFHLGHPIGSRVMLGKSSGPFTAQPKNARDNLLSAKELNGASKKSLSSSLVLMHTRNIAQPFLSAPSIPSARSNPSMRLGGII